jgi:DNA-binding MarR family transcriptional regulator
MIESLGYYISTISKYINLYINREAAALGINIHQMRIMKRLYEHEGIHQEELTDLMRSDKITISKLLDPLVQRGYIEKVKNAEDKRIRNLYITEAGWAIKDEIDAIHKRTTTVLSRHFTDEDQQRVRVLLDQMLENIYQEVLDETTGNDQ